MQEHFLGILKGRILTQSTSNWSFSNSINLVYIYGISHLTKHTTPPLLMPTVSFRSQLLNPLIDTLLSFMFQ